MVNRGNHIKYQPDHIGKLYGSGYQCFGLPERFIISDRCNGKCFTGNTHYISRRPINFLCRWKCNTYFQCRNHLFMVNRGNHIKYQPDHIGKLYGAGN